MAGTIRPGCPCWLFSVLAMDLASWFQICVYFSCMWEPSEPNFHCMCRTGWDTVLQCPSLSHSNRSEIWALCGMLSLHHAGVNFLCCILFMFLLPFSKLAWGSFGVLLLGATFPTTFHVNIYDMSPLYRVICSSVTEHWSQSHFCWCFNESINLKGEKLTFVHSWRDLKLWSFGLVTLWWRVWGRGKLYALW